MRVRFYDEEQKRTFVFLTNNFDVPALTIAQLFKERWKIELLFKWIKQHLKIKAFYGSSENAVYSQIWIAVCSYLLLAIAKKHWQLEESLYTISQVLEFCIFDKISINELFTNNNKFNFDTQRDNQLNLFDL